MEVQSSDRPRSGHRTATTMPVWELLRAVPVFDAELPDFDPDTAPADPASLFLHWLAEALEARLPEPHAMSLATVDKDGRPSSRLLLCKDIDPDGRWYFASSSASRKGIELAENPAAALTFHWPAQGRQIRVRGRAAPTDGQRSAADFLARSPAARAATLASRQSQILTDPAELEAAEQNAEDQLAADPDLVAPEWTLYALTADEVEFWQADRHRRHVRLRYERMDGTWTRARLWP